MSDEINIEIELKGKIFKKPRTKDAIKKGIEKMTLVTEARVKKELYPGHGVLTGHLRRSVSGQVLNELSAQVDAGEFNQGANVVYASWVEGVSARNAQTSFAGYKMFQKAKEELQREDKDKYFKEPIKETLG
tara:strand:- start:196 stop:591 length:396 start_codon:yes stop_codon:yes gene_type:complete